MANKKSIYSDLNLKELEIFVLGLVKDHHKGLTQNAFLKYRSSIKKEARKHAERLLT